MTKRLREQLEQALARKRELDQLAHEQQSFAYSLASQSMAAHVDDLQQQLALLDTRPVIELLEFRLKAPGFHDGSVPLRLIAKAAEELRQMIGYAALRLTRGGIDRKRVPEDVYNELDLRLAAVLPGSSRLVVTTASHRDLLDDGLAKGSLDRVFNVLESQGHGEPFLEAVTDLGPSGARRLRDLLHLVLSAGAELDLQWRYSGETVRSWDGNDKSLSSVAHALDVTEITAKEEIVLSGVIELLSKRERIHLRTDQGKSVRILFPGRLLPKVAELHLEQAVRLRCFVTETLNPLTNETSTFYELQQVDA
jgi:hypothetical protein